MRAEIPDVIVSANLVDAAANLDADTPGAPMNMLTQSLDGAWTLQSRRLVAGAPVTEVRVPATVPGSVHLDLLAAGLIADPFVDANEALQFWVGESDWELSRQLVLGPGAPGERVELVFHGLDTAAAVVLDGQLLGTTENMHRTYRFDITEQVQFGGADHSLAVRFASPVEYAVERRDRLGDLPNPYNRPFNFIRKMACNFGWDWGPQLTTSAVWRSVDVVRWSTARLGAVRVSAGLADDGTGVLDVSAEVVHGSPPEQAALRVAIEIGGVVTEIAVPAGSALVAARIEVPAAAQWMPRGRGAQPMYDVGVTLWDDDAGQTRDQWTRRVGFRTIAIDRTPDPAGERFAITINGARVWVRGMNWIPAACFPGQLQRSDYAQLLADAAEAGCNLIRVWGGGIYESDDFYDLCDELGLLVWQDFLFACAAYPEELLAAEVEAEATDNITRLMSHPSLALWCGNNENLWGWEDWDWKRPVGDRTWGGGFYHHLLPDLVARLDPTRPYIAGSPCSSGDRHPNDPATGPIHIWDVWNDCDYVDYLAYRPRFVSEFGFQAPATYATLSRVITQRPIEINGVAMGVHQKANDGELKLRRSLDAHFGSVDGLDDWWFFSQVNQAKAIETGVGHFRAQHDHCSGVIWWQLNDCWPVVSWSVIDFDGRRKPSWFATRAAFADRTVVFDTVLAGELSLVFINDTCEAWTATARLAVLASGSAVHSHDIAVTVSADGSTSVPITRIVGADAVAVVADIDGVRRLHIGSRRELPTASFSAHVQAREGGATVTVTAANLVTDLCLFADRLHPTAVVDSQLVHLLPGESHSFEIDCADVDVDWSPAIHRPVLRATNDR